MRPLLILALLFCWAMPAGAQSRDELREAEGHYKQAEAFFAAKAFDKAYTEFEAAYKLAPEPLLLFNMGLCDQKLGRKKAALDHFKQYVEAQPRGERVAEASDYIVALTKALDEEAAQAEAQRKADAAARARRQREEAERQHQEEARRRQEAEKQRQAEAERRHEQALAVRRRHGRIVRIAGLGTAAVGLLALGVSGKYALDARSIDHEFSTHQGAWTDAQLDRAADGKAANTRTIIAAGVGGALIVGGAVLYWQGWRMGREARPTTVSVAPAAAPGWAGVTVSGCF